MLITLASDFVLAFTILWTPFFEVNILKVGKGVNAPGRT